MMKVVSAKQMAHIEAQAYQAGASEEDFMEEAGSGVALVVHDYIERHLLNHRILLLCGKGNNAGDAYVAGMHLRNFDYEVVAYQSAPIEECSFLCKQNYYRFVSEGGQVIDASSINQIKWEVYGILVDGLFGTGFHGQVREPYASVICEANESGVPIIAVDIPSGLNGETGKAEGAAIKADETAFLGLPKTGFFLEEGWNHVGKLRYVDFGLPQEYIDSSTCDLVMLSGASLKPFLPKIVRNRHKYAAGYVVGLAGTPSMPGAALLSANAALKGGAGMVKLLHPEGMDAQLSSSPYELIKVEYRHEEISPILELMNQAAATFIGPGMGRTPQAVQLLEKVLPHLEKPCVVDADALWILSEKEILLPKDCVLTPHTGELARLMGRKHLGKVDLDLLEKCRSFSEKIGATLVLKGGPTFIFHKGEPFYVCSKGDPGMATAGSGDILTGLISALMSQGKSPLEAAMIGVYIHGLAGEFAAEEMTSYCMTATDILYYFPEAFRFLEI